MLLACVLVITSLHYCDTILNLVSYLTGGKKWLWYKFFQTFFNGIEMTGIWLWLAKTTFDTRHQVRATYIYFKSFACFIFCGASFSDDAVWHFLQHIILILRSHLWFPSNFLFLCKNNISNKNQNQNECSKGATTKKKTRKLFTYFKIGTIEWRREKIFESFATSLKRANWVNYHVPRTLRSVLKFLIANFCGDTKICTASRVE